MSKRQSSSLVPYAINGNSPDAKRASPHRVVNTATNQVNGAANSRQAVEILRDRGTDTRSGSSSGFAKANANGEEPNKTRERVAAAFGAKLFQGDIQLGHALADAVFRHTSDLAPRESNSTRPSLTTNTHRTLTIRSREVLHGFSKKDDKVRSELKELCEKVRMKSETAKAKTRNANDDDDDDDEYLPREKESLPEGQATIKFTKASESETRLQLLISLALGEDQTRNLEDNLGRVSSASSSTTVSASDGVLTAAEVDAFPHYDANLPCGFANIRGDAPSSSTEGCRAVGARYVVLRDTWMWPRCGGRGGLMSSDQGRTTLAKCISCGYEWQFNDFS